MKNFKLVYMDGYDEVRDLETQEVIFSTKIPEDLSEYLDITTINPIILDKVVEIWNTNDGDMTKCLFQGGAVDNYLMDEGLCSQEELEIICDSLYDYHMKLNRRIVYKLFRVLKSGEITPLFINKTQRLPIGEWLESENHPTKGYKQRQGWHCTAEPSAPHLTNKGRAWYQVEIEDHREELRPTSQGGLWYLAQRMKIIKKV